MKYRMPFKGIVAVAILSIVAIGPCLVVAQETSEEKPPDAVAGGLVLLSVDKAKVHVGDMARFTRIIRNNSEEHVTAYPFRYMNDNVRFYWVNKDTLITKRYGDGKDGMAPSFTLKPGEAKQENLEDDVVTKVAGTYFVFISCRRPGTTDRSISNVVELQVLPMTINRNKGTSNTNLEPISGSQ